MSRQARTIALLCSVMLSAYTASGTKAGTITQTASIPLSSTDFGPQSMVVTPFDNKGGTRVLDEVDINLHALIQNNFNFTFNTAGTIRESVATGNPLSPGPTITIFQPDGSTPILTVQSPNDQSLLTRMVTWGNQPGQSLPQTFGSDKSTSSPFYIAPAVFQRSSSLQLTTPADLSTFTGAGNISLPVKASAVSDVTYSMGNGSDVVKTNGSADVSVTYLYHNLSGEFIQAPEASSLILWGLGALAGSRAWLKARRRKGR